MALTVPVVLLLRASEAALRVVWYGCATDFFHPSLVGGQKVFIENERYALRVFPLH